MSDKSPDPKTTRTVTSKRTFIALVGAAAVLLGGAFSLQSVAGTKTAQHIKVHADNGGGWFGGAGRAAGWRHGRHHGFLDLSEAEITSRLTRIMKHVAIEIDATQEQQDKIVALVSDAVKELRPLRDGLHATGREMRDLLLSDNLDRDAMERLRAERLAETDRISKTLINTLADVAEVLSPAQRKLLEERIKEFRGRRGGWRHG